MTSLTRAGQVRWQVGLLDAEGLDAGQIAERLRITVAQVDHILDSPANCITRTPPPPPPAPTPAAAAAAPAAAAKRAAKQQATDNPKVQVRWLIPRGVTIDGAYPQYAVRTDTGDVRPCTFETAELAALHGDTVMSRWVTDWVTAQ